MLFVSLFFILADCFLVMCDSTRIFYLFGTWANLDLIIAMERECFDFLNAS